MNTLLAQLTSIRTGSLTPVFGLLIDTALKGSLLILAAAIAAYLLRGRSAAARHAAWSAAVVGHLALPILTLLVPQWRIPILPAPPWLDPPAPVSAPQIDNQAGRIPVSASLSANSPPRGATTQITPGTTAPTTITEPTAAPKNPASVDLGASSTVSAATKKWPLVSVFGFLWIIGAALVLLRLAIGTWRVGRLAKNGDRVDDGEWLSLTQRLAKGLGITRPLTLLRGNSLAVPVTWGVVYPAVLLPPDAGEWPEARRRFVLVHEMAHVKRFDALTQLVAQITIAILWFDPLIWIAAHRMRVEREHACDDYVLRDGTTPSLYAGELLEMVQSIGSPRHDSAAPAFAALAMARRSEFEGRMLAILDPRQNRHTLGRTSAMIASVALALLVIPLAALRPFETSAVRTAPRVMSRATPVSTAPTPAAGGHTRRFSDTACDSVMNLSEVSNSTHIHVDEPDDGLDRRIIEFLAYSPGHCSQAVVIGSATFANDRLIALTPEAFASFREMASDGDRVVRVLPGDGGILEYIPSLNGKRVAYDDGMRAWLGRFVPEVLREAGIDAPQRVTRDMARGGVSLVLANIGRTKSPASKRAHYEALLDGRPLTDAEYAQIRRHATQNLYGSSSDLSAVLTRIGAGPAAGTKGLKNAVTRLMQAQEAMGDALGTALEKSRSSAESASTMTQYAMTDDPEVLLMALRGAKSISSDTDRRILLQTVAAGALRRKSSVLRVAFFEAAIAMTSDTDLRITLTSALPYGHADPAVTLAVFRIVANQMSSDTDKRIVLSTAAEQHLLTTSELRTEFMSAAKTIQSSTDFTVVMQSALKQ